MRPQKMYATWLSLRTTNLLAREISIQHTSIYWQQPKTFKPKPKLSNNKFCYFDARTKDLGYELGKKLELKVKQCQEALALQIRYKIRRHFSLSI